MDFTSKFDPTTKVWSGLKFPWPFAPETHISEIIVNGLRKTPQRVVQISADNGAKMTCQDLLVQIIRVAQNLAKVGVKDKDVVSVVCANSFDLMALTNGIIQLGAIVNPMSVEHDVADLVNMFRQTEPILIVCDASVHSKVQEALTKLDNKAKIYVALGEVEDTHSLSELFEPTSMEESYEPGKFLDIPNKTMAILASSGTSGPSKGVCISQDFMLKFYFPSPAPKEVRMLNFSPIFWASAFGSLILATITDETRIVTAKPFTPETFFDIATRFKAVQATTNPPTLTMLLESPLLKTFDKSHLRTFIVMGGMASEALRESFKREFPDSHMMIFYGSTEVSVSMVFAGQ